MSLIPPQEMNLFASPSQPAANWLTSFYLPFEENLGNRKRFKIVLFNFFPVIYSENPILHALIA